jgi:hypothetical protein
MSKSTTVPVLLKKSIVLLFSPKYGVDASGLMSMSITKQIIAVDAYNVKPHLHKTPCYRLPFWLH